MGGGGGGGVLTKSFLVINIFHGRMGGSRGGTGVLTIHHLKNKKNIGFLCNACPDPLKTQSYQASIQCWVIITYRPMMAQLKRYLDPLPPPPPINYKKLTPSDKTLLSGSAHVFHRHKTFRKTFILMPGPRGLGGGGNF